MATEDFKRKLSAVFSADVVGYSRMMGENEAETVKTLETYKGVMFTLIKQHRGRVVDSPGDNLLAEFGSVVDAVQCAVAVQKELQARNSELPEERKMLFRIGINLGDVIEEKERLYGDGVNIAARLEALADPGGICVSKTAFDHIESKLPLGYEFLGEQEVKNITKPVGAYKVLMETRVVGVGEKKETLKTPFWRKKAVISLAILVVLVVAAGLFWNFHFRRPTIERASEEKMAFPLPEKPSIAVLPFDNLSTDPEQDLFADGIAEDIITRLSVIHNLFVTARNSSFSYKGKKVKVQQVAEELGVRYVLEGSVRKSGEQVRITVQLIDAIKGTHLWADRYDRELKEVFAVQDEITRKVVTELAVQLTEGENARMMQQGTNNWEAWINYRQAVAQFRRFNRGANLKARELSEKAIALDANYSQSYSLLSWTYAWPVRMGFSKSPAEDLKKAEELAGKASALDASNHDAQNVFGFIYMLKGQYDKAIVQGKRAVELAPNVTDTYALLALSQSFAGHDNDAIENSIKAMRLAPFYPPWFLTTLFRSYFMAGRFEEAIETIHRFLEKRPDNLHAPVWLAAAYAALGQLEKARAEAEKILKKQPTFSLEKFSKAYPYKNRADFDRMLAHAREAGLPDKPPLPLPDKPSIAVLPFVNMSGDPEQDFFSDGLTEEIITALSKAPQLFVIASNTSFTYKGKPVKVKKVGKELGVQYVIEGSVRREGERVRVTAQMIDALKDRHLWAERYDKEFKDIFSIQDDITKKIITAVHVKLTEGERARVFAKGTSNLQAYLKAVQADWFVNQATKDSVLRAEKLAEEAIALDPNYAYAHMTLGTVKVYYLFLGMSQSPRDTLMRVIKQYKKAVDLNPESGEAHALLAYGLVLARQYDKAAAECERAMALEPNSYKPLYHCASTLTFIGRREEAIPLFREALRINPKPPNSCYRHLGVALRDSGRYDEAIEVSKKATERKPNDLIAWVVLASSYGLAGREEEAKAAAKEILRINPAYSVDRLEKVSPHKDRAVAKRFCDALRKAGLK